MAPELAFVMRCPWLSRTAGRPVYRPIPAALLANRMQPLIVSLQCTVLGFTAAMASAREAMEVFGKSVAAAMAPRVKTPEATGR